MMKLVLSVIQIALQIRFDAQTISSDSLYYALISIMVAQLEDRLSQPATIDLLLQLLITANVEATQQCNAECKYYSNLLRFKLIHHLFISSPNATQILQYQLHSNYSYHRDYVNTRGESCFIKNSELFFVNSSMINPGLTCYVCNQKIRSRDGVTCYCCGKSFHLHCSNIQQLVITLPNCQPMCVFCCRSDIASLQRTFIQNLSSACNYLSKLRPFSFEANEFHVEIVNEIMKYDMMNQLQAIDSLVNLYNRFYKKGTVVCSVGSDFIHRWHIMRRQ